MPDYIHIDLGATTKIAAVKLQYPGVYGRVDTVTLKYSDNCMDWEVAEMVSYILTHVLTCLWHLASLIY